MINESHRVIFLGSSDVGKTSLIVKITKNTFDSYLENTVMVDFTKYQYKYDQKEINLTLWDTAGQEQYRSITTHHFKGAKFFILVCAVDNYYSLEELNFFLELIYQKADKDINIILLCNKADLDLSEHQINLDQLLSFKESHKIDIVQFVSAKNGEGICDFLDSIAELILKENEIGIKNGLPVDLADDDQQVKNCCK